MQPILHLANECCGVRFGHVIQRFADSVAAAGDVLLWAISLPKRAANHVLPEERAAFQTSGN
jgi:hypothetical protein